MLHPESQLYTPARFVWRHLISRYRPVREFVEQHLLYPHLPHIKRSAKYTEGPWLVAGFFNSAHGIGEAARLQVENMQKQGDEVYAIDICQPFGIQDTSTTLSLCTLDLAPAHGTLLLHCNAPEAGRALQYLGKRLTQNRKIIGYWAWELEIPPKNWHKAYAYFDELWVLSHHTAAAFKDAPVPVHVVPPIVQTLPDGGHTRKALGIPESMNNAFLFLCMADCRSDLVRKNIYGAVQAFSQALGGNPEAGLVVKLHHTEFGGEELARIKKLCASHDNIFVMEKLLSQEERNSLIHRSDVALSLHRAEGFGLFMAEALKLGKTVIGTAYSGNMDFMDDENSVLIPYVKVPVQGGMGNYYGYDDNLQWAEPDIGTAQEKIVELFEKRRAGD